MSLQRLTPGTKFRPSARSWNAFADAAELVQLDQSGIRDGAPGDAAAHVDIKNESGAFRAIGEVLGLGAPIRLPTDDAAGFRWNNALKGATPTNASHRYKFAVLDQPLAQNEIGRAIVAGVVWAKVNIVSTDHAFANLKDSDATQLESYWWGKAQILWQESGTGTKWCQLLLGAWTFGVYRGTTAAPHNKGDTGTVNVGSSTITGVYNPWANIGTGKVVSVQWCNNQPEIQQGECPLT